MVFAAAHHVWRAAALFYAWQVAISGDFYVKELSCGGFLLFLQRLMKRCAAIFLMFCAFCCSVMAQDTVRHVRFSGGMMLHTGYLTGTYESIDYHAKGMPFGLGGAVRFHFFDHLRVGGEGYVSNLRQMHNGSYIRLGWGGVLVDGYWSFGRWMPYVGFTVGGGSLSTLLVCNGDAGDWASESDAILHNAAVMVLDSFVGVEFSVTKAFHLTLKADYMLPLSNRECPTGVRVYFGFMFAR